MKGIFGELYADDAWKLFPGGDGRSENLSRSGSGSDLVQTAALRQELPALLAQLGVHSLLDIPCGDLYWMSQVELGVDSYLGADVVPEVVEQNQRKFARADRGFRVLDITRSRLPQVDMVFSRDCLVHFSNADVRAALDNIRRSGSTYFATTTFTGRVGNAADIETGGWRSLNLCRAPFSLPAPLHLIDERCTEVYVSEEGGAEVEQRFTDKSIGVWRTADL
ncbi:class I SAM-dependent methyltransferase [Streptomyces sp. NPDC059788]|uniref:class I SAM-dependent methyltransferase n=1 Tax=Streptomyces sp. NPDC059788 TaxID=3346948 RepID=UPI003663EFAE